MSYCAVKSCQKKSSDHENLSFFIFPSDPLMRKLWIDNCYLTHLFLVDTVPSSSRVCADHFEDKMFSKPWTRDHLIHNAVPTLISEVTLLNSPEELTIKKEEEFETKVEEFEAKVEEFETKVEEFKTKVKCPSCSRPLTDEKAFTIQSYDNVTSFIKSEISETCSSKIPLQLMCVHPENIKLLNEIESADQEIADLKKKLAVAYRLLVEVSTEEQMLKLCKIHLQPSLNLFIQNCIENRCKELKDYCYSNQILDLGKALYLISPVNLYYNLQFVLQLHLPPLSVLKPILKSNELHPADSDLNN